MVVRVLRAVLANAGVTNPPILDWFHIAMRLQHTELAARNLSTDDPDRVTAKAAIVAEVKTSALAHLERQGEDRHSAASSGSARSCMSSKASTARARSAWRRASCGTRCMRSVNTSEAKPRGWSTTPKRFRADERVGTSITEGTANFLVNRRMNKSQQMRWSREGADLLLQVRCAVYSGTLGAGLGHRFERRSNADLALAKAA